ncbi:MAG: hypothetical protein OEY00_11075 [Gammaproteobacteria bacterium]|nr:hypothetical protein [Gammaproteobacteria bacterium]
MKLKIAFWCHLLAILVVLIFGLMYSFKPTFMPYHSAAVQLPWQEVSPAIQVLILALMRSIGGACFAIVILELFILFIPFRQGQTWAIWAVPAGGLCISAAGLYAMLYVSSNTPATPPLFAPAIGAVLLVSGLLLSLSRK